MPAFIEMQVQCIVGRGALQATFQKMQGAISAGEHLRAITYSADNTAITEGLSPYTLYKDLVLNGAAEHGLPADYIAASIEAVTATKDPDASRDKRNRFN